MAPTVEQTTKPAETARRSAQTSSPLLGQQTEVRQALAGLIEAQRRAVLLAAFYGWTAREISELEGIPLGTAKTRIRDGLARLRSALVEVQP